MTRSELGAHARRGAGLSFAALGLSIPISTAADSVLLALLGIAALIALPGSIQAVARSIASIPAATLAAALFALLALGCLYGAASASEARGALSKYLDLALIPLFVWAAADPVLRKRALGCFCVAVVLNLYVSYSAAAGLPGLRSINYPIGFKASVTHNLMVSLGAFVFLLLARESRDRRLRMTFIALAAVCAHNVLFIVIGRTGYFVLAALFAYFVVATVRGWRGPVLAAVACAVLLAGAYAGSSSFRERIDQVGSDLARWKPDAADGTSVGQRIGYYQTTARIVADHPVLGVGTGGFPRAYAEKVSGTQAPPTTNPHNDYLMIGAQVGIPGVLLLIALYGAVWIGASRAETRLYRDLARGAVLTMALGSLFNSVLQDHVEGLLFAWLVALTCATYQTRRESGPESRLTAA